MAEYECLRETVTSGSRGRLYKEGEIESFTDNPGKHWRKISREQKAAQAEEQKDDQGRTGPGRPRKNSVM